MSHEAVLVWMLSLNREYSRIVCSLVFNSSDLTSPLQEYDTAFQLVKLCFPTVASKYEPTNADSFRECCFICSDSNRSTVNAHSRYANDPITASTHDAAPESTTSKMDRSCYGQRETLDRTCNCCLFLSRPLFNPPLIGVDRSQST